MTTQTKAADPVLPLPSHRHPMSGEPIWDEAAARACYEKARADLLAEMQPVAWVAADTLNSPHPTCISSLAYMSQIDRERGREYVPLTIIDRYAALSAQPGAQRTGGSE